MEARAYDQFGSFDSFDEGMLGPEEEGPDEKVQAPAHPFLIVEITIQSCVKSLLDDVLSEGLSRPLWPLVCADPELSNPRLIPAPEQVFSYLTSDGVFQIREPVKTGPGGMSGATPRRRPRLQQVPMMTMDNTKCLMNHSPAIAPRILPVVLVSSFLTRGGCISLHAWAQGAPP